MRDYLELGPVPCDEDCQAVGMPTFDAKIARAECRAYRRQLARLWPQAEFRVKTFPHDFGSYSEVVVYYDDDCAEDVRLVFEIEDNLPAVWDQVALDELELLYL